MSTTQSGSLFDVVRRGLRYGLNWVRPTQGGEREAESYAAMMGALSALDQIEAEFAAFDNVRDALDDAEREITFLREMGAG